MSACSPTQTVLPANFAYSVLYASTKAIQLIYSILCGDRLPQTQTMDVGLASVVSGVVYHRAALRKAFHGLRAVARPLPQFS
jgi:hypothetical protein